MSRGIDKFFTAFYSILLLQILKFESFTIEHMYGKMKRTSEGDNEYYGDT